MTLLPKMWNYNISACQMAPDSFWKWRHTTDPLCRTCCIMTRTLTLILWKTMLNEILKLLPTWSKTFRLAHSFKRTHKYRNLQSAVHDLCWGFFFSPSRIHKSIPHDIMGKSYDCSIAPTSTFELFASRFEHTCGYVWMHLNMFEHTRRYFWTY